MEEDGFDSMTRSGDEDFHQWYLDTFDIEDTGIDHYEDCEQAWDAGKHSKMSAKS